MANVLENLNAVEVSLVDRPANERKFLIFKNMKGGEEKVGFIDKAKAKTKGKAKKNIDLTAGMEDLTDAQVSGFYGAIRSAWDDEQIALYEDIGASLLASMASRGMSIDADDDFVRASGFAPVVDEEPDKDDDYEGAKKKKVKKGVEFVDVEKILKGDVLDLTDVPENMRGLVSELWKSKSDSVAKEKEAVKKQEELIKKANDLEAVIKKAEDDAKVVEYISKAKEFDALPVKADDFGVVLKDLSEKVPESYESILTLLKSVNESMKSSDIFKEAGSNSSGEGATGSAWEKMEGMAKEIVQKDMKMTKEQAINRVMKDNPALYREYLDENEGGK